MENDGWEKIGTVGVDSGSLMLCDPCYIDSSWQKREYLDIRLYEDKIGRKFAYNTKAAHDMLDNKVDEYFDSYESILSTGRTPNEHNKAGDWKEWDIEDDSFSYNGVCHLKKKPYKQMNYALGHAGLAVVFNSGFGDGHYNVYAQIQNGVVCEVKIVLAKKEDVKSIAEGNYGG